MNDERGYGAMPKLYGAPAYARPPAVPVNRSERPFDPDDLPLEYARTEDDELVAEAEDYGNGAMAAVADAAPDQAGGTGSSRSFRFRLPGR